jgi:hypothetical protein
MEVGSACAAEVQAKPMRTMAPSSVIRLSFIDNLRVRFIFIAKLICSGFQFWRVRISRPIHVQLEATLEPGRDPLITMESSGSGDKNRSTEGVALHAGRGTVAS